MRGGGGCVEGRLAGVKCRDGGRQRLGGIRLDRWAGPWVNFSNRSSSGAPLGTMQVTPDRTILSCVTMRKTTAAHMETICRGLGAGQQAWLSNGRGQLQCFSSHP